MSPWADRRTRALVARTRAFLQGLEAHPGWRARLRAAGYSQTAHRELGALLAQVEAGWEPARLPAVPRDRARPRQRAVGARMLALSAWTGEQVRLAGAAARKVPAVWREAQSVLARSQADAEAPAPVAVARGLWRVLRRVGRDEHLGHFLTAAGLRDARSALRRRLQDAGGQQDEQARQQAAYALSYALARWRAAAREVFADEPEVLEALGLGSPD